MYFVIYGRNNVNEVVMTLLNTSPCLKPFSSSVSPSPCSLVVKEQHQVEPLGGVLLPLLPQMEDVFGWDGDGHPVVQQALLGHLWVDDLEGTVSRTESLVVSPGTAVVLCLNHTTTHKVLKEKVLCHL